MNMRKLHEDFMNRRKRDVMKLMREIESPECKSNGLISNREEANGPRLDLAVDLFVLFIRLKEKDRGEGG